MPPPVRITAAARDALLAHARREPALECCGLLAGRDGVIFTVLPARNALASATAFEIAPIELFELFHRMRSLGLEHMGIYHSHPVGQNTPSRRDIERAYYPGVAYFILSPRAGAANAVRAFTIRDDSTEQLPIEVV
jgi:proteasome lid subunit RPN8/RPN11